MHRSAFRLRPGMRRGLRSDVPLPTRLVSNEAFPPLPERRILAEAGRREFLRRSGASRRGCASSLSAAPPPPADTGREAWSRRFEIPQALVDRHGYAPLTRAVKEQIFGLNAARVFGVDVDARRHEISGDYLSRMKMSYLDEGPVPSHRWYGWVTG